MEHCPSGFFQKNFALLLVRPDAEAARGGEVKLVRPHRHDGTVEDSGLRHFSPDDLDAERLLRRLLRAGVLGVGQAERVGTGNNPNSEEETHG